MIAKLAKIVLSITAGMLGLVLLMVVLAGAGPAAAKDDSRDDGNVLAARVEDPGEFEGSASAAAPPFDVLIDASPAEIRADGDSNSDITGTVRDAGCQPVPTAFIAFTTTLGTIDQYCYVEAEDASVNRSPGLCWSTQGPYAWASAGYYVKACGTVCPSAELSWTFSATAISMLYVKDPEGGVAEVQVDGSTAITVGMYAATKMAAERVITAGLGSGPHIITVKYLTGTAGYGGTCIRVDAFRCGATTDVNGHGAATLTSTILSCGSEDATVTALTGDPSIPYMITNTKLVRMTASSPNSVTLTATPNQIVADGTSTSSLEATVKDRFGEYVPDCTMVSFVTDENGSTPGVSVTLVHELVEGEDPAEVITSGSWSTGTHPSHHGTEAISSTTANDTAVWIFTGTAVSLMYAKLADAGVATVTVDSGLPITIDMYASAPQFQVEHVITHCLGYGPHAITVTVAGYTVTGGTDTRVYVDALRSGASTSGGKATAVLTPGMQAGVVWVEATGVGRQCCETDSVVTDTVPITLTAGDPYTLTITPTDVSITCCMTTTLQFTVTDQYNNVVGAVVPKSLRVRFTSTPYGDFTPINVWFNYGVGSVEFHGWTVGTGTITGQVMKGYNIIGTSNLTVAENSCDTLDINTDRTWIYVTDTNTYLLDDFVYTTTITAELEDICDNPVEDGTVVTFTTSLGYLSSDTITKTTISGLATAVLTSENLPPGVPTMTAYIVVTGTGCPLTETTSVDFVRHVYTLTVTADPDEMRVGGYTSTLTADVDDGLGNPTPDGVTVTFTITPVAMASVPPGSVETASGVATAIATSGTQAGIAKVEAIATGSTITNTTFITITAGDPYTLTITPTDVPITCCITRTLQFTVTDQYNNVVGAVVSRTLTVDFTSTPYGDFTPTSVVITEGVGSVEFHGYEEGTGTITGTVQVHGVVGTSNLAVTAAPCYSLTINADQTRLYVTDTNTSLLTDFIYTTTLTAQMRDICNNPVKDGTVVTFATSLGDVSPAYPTTSGGIATTTLTSEQLPAAVPTQMAYITVTSADCPLTETTSVDFGRHVYTLTVTANPDEMPTGGDTSALTADVDDGFGGPTPDGVMVGFTVTPSIRASVPYEFVEAEDPNEVIAGGWGVTSHPSFHGGQAIDQNTANATATWTFTGTAVSLMYFKWDFGGVATVTVDSTVVMTVDMYAPFAQLQFQVEKVISNTLSPGQHTITVTVAGYSNPSSSGTWVYVDAFRSGTTTSGGTATATATSGTETGVATVEAAAIGSTVTNTTLITITAGDPYTLTITPTDVPITCCITSTLQFTVTDQYSNILGAVASRPVTVCLECNPGGLVDSWSPASCVVVTNGVGSVEFHAWESGTGIIWGNVYGTVPSVEDSVNITISAGSPATLTVTSAPDTILADGFDFAIITATVKDSCDNPVCNRVVTFTADSGSFDPPPDTTLSITRTTNCPSGVATATLRSVCVSRRANITVTVDSLIGTTYVDMAGVAWDVQLVANPVSIQVGGSTSDLTATVNDQFGHPVLDGTVVTFTTSLGDVGSDTTAKTTTGGIATAVLASSNTAGMATITATAGSGVDTATDAVTVTFEAGPPYTVTLEAYPITLTVGNSSTLTATVTDQYANSVIDGTIVTFTTTLGDVGGAFVTKTTTSGLATATLTSQVAGMATVTATADSLYDTTVVTFYADLPYTVTLVAYPISLTVGSTSTLTATVTDQYDNNVADGTVVTLETSLGSLGSITITKGTANGVATATLASQIPGTATVTATADLVSDTVNVTFEAGPAYTLTLGADPMNIPVGGFTSTLTVTVTDQFNNNVTDGTAVLFETSLGSLGSITVTKATAGGVATAVLTSETTAGTAIITATSDSKVATTTVEFTPLSPYTVTLVAYPISLTVGSTSTLTATVTDEYDNNVADGTVVTFETSLGSLGSITITKGTANGVATATLASQIPGTATVTATADLVSDTVNVTFEVGPAYTLTLEADPMNIPVSGFTSTLTITVTDQFNNNVADGTAVLFETSLGSLGSVTVTKATADGVATATLTSGNIAGAAVVTATADSKVATTVVTLTPDVPYTITLIAFPTSLTVVESSVLTATVKDQYDNNVADGTAVTFETSLGSLGSITITKGTANGVATATLTSQVPGTATVTATSDSKVATTTVEFETGLPYTVTLVAYPISLTVGGSSSLTATVEDKYNNNVADGTVVTFETSLGSLGSAEVTKTTISGIATATLSSQVAGTAMVTATSDSLSDMVKVIFNPDLPYTMTLEAYPTSIPIGWFTSTITATIRDQYDNPVADGTEVTFATDLGSVGSSSVVKTTINGVAIATLTSEMTIGTANITATVDSLVGHTQVIFTIGAPYTVTAASWPPTIEVGGNTSTITATVTDIGGYAVADGTLVVFDTDFASLGSTTVTRTTASGVAMATLTSELTPGVAHVTATADSKSDTAIVKIVAGPPSSIDVTANPTYIPIGGATSSITATVKDQYGNDVTNGTNVDFSTTLGTVSPPSDATIEGMAGTTLTSEEEMGIARVTATSGAVEDWVDVVFTLGPPFYVNVVANPTSIGLNGQTSNIQATVKDVGNNNVADGTEVIFITSLGTLGSNTVTKTTAGGVATAILTSGTTAGTAVITATADSKYDIAKVVINPDPPDTVTLTASRLLIPANGTSTSAVRATVTDQYGNMVADGINCYFHTTLGTVWPPSDTTLNGVAETTLTSTEGPGLATVTATCEGKQGTVHVYFYNPLKLYLPVIVKGH